MGQIQAAAKYISDFITDHNLTNIRTIFNVLGITG